MMKKYILFTFVSFLLFPAVVFGVSQKHSAEIYGRYLKGLSYFNEGKYTESLEELERVKRLDPESSHIRLKLAFVLMRLDRLEQAEEEFKAAKQLDPGNLEASLGLIFLYSYLQKNDELEVEYGDFLEGAHRLRPEDIKISEYLAQFYFYKKKLDDAIRIYEVIVDKHPDYLDARYLLGYFYEENGTRNKAISMWKKVLQNSPSHSETLNSLGYIYALEGKRLDEAEKMIKKALEQDPNNGAYLDSLGWVYYKSEKYEKAEEYLQRAIGNTKDAEIYEHLGDLYIKIDDIEKAVDYYGESLKLNPGSVTLKEKVEKYQNKITAIKKESSQDTEIKE